MYFFTAESPNWRKLWMILMSCFRPISSPRQMNEMVIILSPISNSSKDVCFWSILSEMNWRCSWTFKRSPEKASVGKWTTHSKMALEECSVDLMVSKMTSKFWGFKSPKERPKKIDKGLSRVFGPKESSEVSIVFIMSSSSVCRNERPSERAALTETSNGRFSSLTIYGRISFSSVFLIPAYEIPSPIIEPSFV